MSVPPATVRGHGRFRAAPDLAPPGFSIAPAEQLLRLPGFWPAYYVPTWDDFADEPELFGADGADVDAAVDALYGPVDPW